MQRVRIHTRMNHELFSIAMNAIFSTDSNFTYAGPWSGELPNVVEPTGKSGKHRTTDILITDSLAFDSTGDTAATLKQHWPGLRVLCLLPIHSDEYSIVKALKSRADGFLFQTVTREVLLRSVHILANGQSFLQSDITPVVLEELRKARYPVQETSLAVDLTEREHLLLQLSADGLSNQRIGEVLYVHEKTVRNMWSALFQKLGVGDRTQAVLWAIRSGYAELR